MYHNEIEQLIDFALVDGIITEKERKVLINKAINLGIDRDEFEMVLNARLHQSQKNASNTSESADKKNQETKGKCENCNAFITSFSTNCSYCGAEFSNMTTLLSLERFVEKLNYFESLKTETKVNFSSQNDISIITLFKWWMFWWYYLPLKIFKTSRYQLFFNQWTTIDSRKEEFILNFPVPNSKEEIIEFLTLFLSKIQYISIIKRWTIEGRYINRWNNVWANKSKQLLFKAKIALKNDNNAIEFLNSIMKEKNIK